MHRDRENYQRLVERWYYYLAFSLCILILSLFQEEGSSGSVVPVVSHAAAHVVVWNGKSQQHAKSGCSVAYTATVSLDNDDLRAMGSADAAVPVSLKETGADHTLAAYNAVVAVAVPDGDPSHGLRAHHAAIFSGSVVVAVVFGSGVHGTAFGAPPVICSVTAGDIDDQAIHVHDVVVVARGRSFRIHVQDVLLVADPLVTSSFAGFNLHVYDVVASARGTSFHVHDVLVTGPMATSSFAGNDNLKFHVLDDAIIRLLGDI